MTDFLPERMLDRGTTADNLSSNANPRRLRSKSYHSSRKTYMSRSRRPPEPLLPPLPHRHCRRGKGMQRITSTETLLEKV